LGLHILTFFDLFSADRRRHHTQRFFCRGFEPATAARRHQPQPDDRRLCSGKPRQRLFWVSRQCLYYKTAFRTDISELRAAAVLPKDFLGFKKILADIFVNFLGICPTQKAPKIRINLTGHPKEIVL